MLQEGRSRQKQKAKDDAKVHAVGFDLQQVLSTPNLLTSTVYYKCKLSVYNLSVYSLGSRVGTCFLWSEIDGARGANEIGTCMSTYINCLPSTVEHVIMYSDACCGQNRNCFFLTAIINTLLKNQNIKCIDHKFTESGHFEMEVNSKHAAIETAKTKVKVHLPSDWQLVCRLAHRKNPYTVIPMKNNEFINFHEMAVSVDVNMNQVKWREVKCLRLTHATSDPSLVIICRNAIMMKSSQCWGIGKLEDITATY